MNIQEILLEMRRDRMGLIQTPDQLRFSYQAIIEGAKRLNPDWVSLRNKYFKPTLYKETVHNTGRIMRLTQRLQLGYCAITRFDGDYMSGKFLAHCKVLIRARGLLCRFS